jgi:hypothetical protein
MKEIIDVAGKNISFWLDNDWDGLLWGKGLTRRGGGKKGLRV